MSWARLALPLALAAAAASAETLRVALRWKEVPTAQGYELQIARDAAFVEVVLQTRTAVAGYRWEQLPTQPHWWRVRTFDAEGRPSEWSAARTIIVEVPVPEPRTPADKATLPCGPEVAFTVEPGPLLGEYQVELARSPDFAQPRVVKDKGPVLSAGRLSPGRWYWRTRGVGHSGRPSELGPAQSLVVRLGTPTPRLPAEVVLGAEVPVAWPEVPCAASYAVEATHEAGQKLSAAGPRPGAALRPKAAGEFRARVAAVDESGVAGDWSAEVPFRVLLPPPQPLSERSGPEVELAWAPAAGATAYRLELARGPDSGAASAIFRVTAARWASGELEPGPYRWRVAALDAQGHASAASAARAFEVKPQGALPPPTVLAPGPDEVLDAAGAVRVQWTQGPEATSFDVELDGALQPPVAGPQLTLASLRPALHSVRVRANGKRARQSDWTAAREFFVGPPRPVRAEVSARLGEVVVRLFDVRGRALRAPAPSLSVKAGRLGAAELGHDGWRAPWEPPASGRDLLVVTEGEFRLEQPLQLEAAARWSVGARGGGLFNGGALASPTGTLSLLHRLAPLGGHLTLELRAGVAAAASSLDLGPSRVGGAAWLLPVSLLAGWRQALGPVELRGAVGPSLQVAALRVGAEGEWTAAPGLEVAVAVGRALGPGVLEVEGLFRWGRVDTGLARLNAGGVGLQVGYVWALQLGGR